MCDMSWNELLTYFQGHPPSDYYINSGKTSKDLFKDVKYKSVW